MTFQVKGWTTAFGSSIAIQNECWNDGTSLHREHRRWFVAHPDATNANWLLPSKDHPFQVNFSGAKLTWFTHNFRWDLISAFISDQRPVRLVERIAVIGRASQYGVTGPDALTVG